VRTVAPTRVEHVSVWLPIPARAALASSTKEAVASAMRGPDGSGDTDSAPSIVLDVHERDVAVLTRRLGTHEQLDALLDSGPLALGVDHFTASTVPLGMLQQLSAASVSIDPLLLTDAARNPGTAEVVHALVTAAGALGVVSIAMDVESHEQLDLARALGVHAVYGDLIGPPAPLDTYADLLHGGRVILPTVADEWDGDTAPTTVAAVEPATPPVVPEADAEPVDEAPTSGPFRPGPPVEGVTDVSDDAWAALIAGSLGQGGQRQEPTVEQQPDQRAAAEHAPVVLPEPAAEGAAAAPVVEPAAEAAPVIDVRQVAAPVVAEPAPGSESWPLPGAESAPAAPASPAAPAPAPGGVGDAVAAELGYAWAAEPPPAVPGYRTESPVWDALAQRYPEVDESPVWAELLRRSRGTGTPPA